jgi:adenylate cyclase
MQQPGGSGRSAKGQRTVRPKAHKELTAHVSTDHSAEQFDRLKRERDEALEQLAATSEILRVIRTSPTDVQPVFETIVRNAVSLCGSLFANVFRFDGGLLHWVASHNVGPSYVDLLKAKFPMRPDRSQVAGRVLLTKSVIRLENALTDPDYDQRFPGPMGWRRMLGVPMLREGDPLGVIVVGWAQAGPVPKTQEQLLKTFADQAAIAIENVRLFNETKEALDRQTATSEVLKVISSSPGELEPVFDALLTNATRICAATFGNLFLRDDHLFHAVAVHGEQSYVDHYRRNPEVDLRDNPGIPLDRVVSTKQVIHLADLRTDQSYLNKNDRIVRLVEIAGARGFLLVPMLKAGEVVGAIVIYRQEVQPFYDKQIDLVKNFSVQAVIAIENTRLLKELRERTGELEARSQEVVKLNQQLERRVADQVGEIERMSRLRRFLSPQVADLIIASGMEKQLESHRREITALFCDLRGFTGFSEISDPEDVMSLLRDYHAAIGEIIIKYNGTLEHYAGDGVMVLFNDPIPVLNPALQAVRMALEMRTAIGALIEKWHRLGHEIGFGIGIAHGFATLGTIGFEGRFDYAAIGTVANVASRLCDEAKPGQILISPRVLMAVEDAVTVEPVGDFALKGLHRPIAAYNVLSAVSSKI